MPLSPNRFKRIQSVLNRRMGDLTVLLENVEKPHNLSAILRSCDAVGVLEAHAICQGGKTNTFNSTAQGSQKWVELHDHTNIVNAVKHLKSKNFQIYGTNLDDNAIDYRECDFCAPTAFVLGAEKWGLKKKTTDLMDKSIYIPMGGMVQSLNVSVAAAILLFEALRQRKEAGITPENGEGLSENMYEKKIFEWSYPAIANWCQKIGRDYPKINSQGEIVEDIPREK